MTMMSLSGDTLRVLLPLLVPPYASLPSQMMISLMTSLMTSHDVIMSSSSPLDDVIFRLDPLDAGGAHRQLDAPAAPD